MEPSEDSRLWRFTIWVRDNPEWTAVFFFSTFWFLALGLCVFTLEQRPLSLALAFGASAAGALPGFLLAMPRTHVRAGPSGAEDDGSPSSNLEQIVDWLVKILIGAGLVELQTLTRKFGELCRTIAGPNSGSFSQAVAGSWIIFFATVGFLAAYNLTRVYLVQVYSRMERRIARQRQVVAKRSGELAQSQNLDVE